MTDPADTTPRPVARPTTEGLLSEGLTPAQRAVAVLAHELRGPLAVVLGYLGILERPLDEEAREHALGAARRAAERMDALIEDALGAVDPARERPPAPQRLIGLREYVSQVVADLPPSEIVVVVMAEDDGMVVANELEIGRAFGNVLGNALKFSPRGGTVTVTVAREDDHVILSVEDEGPGIPEQDRERVFEPLARLERDSRTPGTGLGLGLTRDLVNAAGGTIAVCSPDAACGTRVVIELPCAPA